MLKSRCKFIKLLEGLRTPDPANLCSEFETQPTIFCCTYSHKSVMNLHRLFNMFSINTHFDMFFKNKGMYGCHIFVGHGFC